MENTAEQTLVIFKPDALKRGLLGTLISRFEVLGLELIELKLMKPNKELLEKHYTNDPIWVENLGSKTMEFFKKHELWEKAKQDLEKMFETSNPKELGMIIRGLLIDFMMQGSIITSIWRGAFACSKVRKLVGHTVPISAEPGTIRGDFSLDSPLSLITEGRAIANLVHASGDVNEAKREIALWFPEIATN